MSPAKWVIALAAVVLVVGMIIWARGDEHHRGDDTGSVAQVGR